MSRESWLVQIQCDLSVTEIGNGKKSRLFIVLPHCICLCNEEILSKSLPKLVILRRKASVNFIRKHAIFFTNYDSQSMIHILC